MAEELAKQRTMQLSQSRFKKEMAVDYETRFGIDSFWEAINSIETETKVFNMFEAGDNVVVVWSFKEAQNSAHWVEKRVLRPLR